MRKTIHWVTGMMMIGAIAADAQTVVQVTADITADTTWDSDTDDDGTIDQVYLIDTAISVKAPSYGTTWEQGDPKVTLTITPGTVIAGTGSGVGSGASVGSLVVTRSGRLEAAGTAEAPIIFTSVLEAEARLGLGIDIDGDMFINDTTLNPVTDGGEWGGVILLGSAPINFTSGGVNVGEASIEGFPAGSSADIVYGGSDAGDDSGTLRYVRIEFGGYEFEPNEEINGLTLGGVGCGTTVEFVEVVGNTDDGFEFFGGTVNTKWLIGYFNQDETFDLDQGHQGTHQFWFALQSTASDNGTEADGGDGDTKTLDPMTLTRIYNATYIGGGANSAKGNNNDGFRLKDNFAGQFHNSIFHDFGGQAVRIDDADTAGQVGLNLNFTHNVWGAFASGPVHGAQSAEADLLAQAGNTVVGTDPLLSTLTRSGNEVVAIDPRPVLAGPAWTGGIAPGAPLPANYRGAFAANNWAAGWTYMEETGVLANTFIGVPVIVVEHVTADITADTTWDSDTNDDGILDKVYLIDAAISVKDPGYGTSWTEGDAKVTLTIEPGTVVAGTGTGVGSSASVGSLVVTRSGRLDAQGTAMNPIIFTSVLEAESRLAIDIDGDEFTNDISLDPATDGGEWGGVILLGSAPINFTSGGENVGEASIEGFPAGSSADIVYGGGTADDDSGILRYLRIEFGGYEFEPNEEINGLTLGGVGCGTTVEFVEVVGNTDDGFEFFGGTVNTRWLVGLFNQDESFDLDQGHSGTHQFWFALQSTASDNGTEADGGDGDTKTLTPLTLTKVYNATYIGGGALSAKGNNNDGFRLKDNFAGQFHNSIFHDFGGQAVRIDDADTAGQVGLNLNFTHNVWGAFASGPVHGGQSAEADLLAQTGNTAVGTDPQLGSLLRSASGELVSMDPRPALGGPAWDTVTAGGLSAANYRGAFGTTNWTQTWTYASAKGYVVSCGIAKRSVVIEPIAADITVDTTLDSDTDDDGIVDKIYLIDTAISVKAPGYGDTWTEGDAKVTLTIEPGTVVAGTGTGVGSSASVGSLVVTRSGRLDAQGTATNPIIFTSVLEAESRFGYDIDGDAFVNDVPLDPATDGGEWGGVILLGSAPINFASGGVNVGEASIEGFPAGSSADIVYGGSTSNDDSGILRYVRIEFGGYEFEPNEEINGLTLGGVGSGTTVEFVEVVGNTDDGYEFFGGTVNTKWLVGFFNQDESFDLDQGHQGTHQFWLAVQSIASDNGTEADGGDGDTKTLLPLTNTKIYNATYLGGGANSAKGNNNDGFRLKDNFAGQFHNSIFHDFGGQAVRIDDADTAGQVGGNLCITNSIWGAFASGPVHGGQSAESDLLAQFGNTAVGTDPELSVLWRMDNEIASIDPRPGETSAAWGNTLVQGAPTQVAYRGAFGDTNWAHTWTYMSNFGYFEPCFGQFELPDATYVDHGAAEVIVITDVSLAGASMTIAFAAEIGANYKVTYSPDLQATFTDVPGATVMANAPSASATFTVPAGSNGFYRIVKQ